MVPRALRGAPSCGTFSGSGFTSKCDAQQGAATFTAGASGCGHSMTAHRIGPAGTMTAKDCTVRRRTAHIGKMRHDAEGTEASDAVATPADA